MERSHSDFDGLENSQSQLQLTEMSASPNDHSEEKSEDPPQVPAADPERLPSAKVSPGNDITEAAEPVVPTQIRSSQQSKYAESQGRQAEIVRKW